MQHAPTSYRPKQAAEFLGIGVSTLWRWLNERADMPRPIKLSSRVAIFDGQALREWRDAQAAKAVSE